MKSRVIIVAWICMMFCFFSACGGRTETAAGFQFDTGSYQPPKAFGTTSQDILYLDDVANLNQPETILYVVDGKVKTFLPTDAAFAQILELNAARDVEGLLYDTDRDGNPRGVRDQFRTLLTDANYYKTGRYLIYHYGQDGYHDIIFSLRKEAEVDYNSIQTCTWMTEQTGEETFGPLVTGLAPADELIAFIEST